ncbi:MAG TPA: enoyl-CoA hydratase/isomerase family protein [Bacteroides sp.]|nr:enoyl-CoA hydratase/isomerase family protein [Bacteroides sp.]
MPGKIVTEVNGKVLDIILNNPDKMNCMGFEMLRALDKAIEDAANNKDIRVVQLRGAGERAFSTGADLKEFDKLKPEQADEWIEFGNAVFNKVEKMPKPVVAMINGYAIGGGLELALACDFRLGTESAVLASVELQHGWLPGWGGMTRLRRLIGEAKAKEMVMLCEKIPAHRALEMGLLTKVLKRDSEQEELEKILEHLSSLKPEAFKLAKSALMDSDRTTEGADIQFDVHAMNLANSKS